MKKLINFSTDSADTGRYSSAAELVEAVHGMGFDGVELNYIDEDPKGKIPASLVLGLHMRAYPSWLDFWLGNEEALLEEFGTLDEIELFYGGLDRSVLVETFRNEMRIAHQYGAEYVVFHVSECTIPESLCFKFKYSDDEVIGSMSNLIGEILRGEDGGIAFLMENLWYPGLTLTRPESTRLLLDSVEYANKGIMLDTGHMLHTDFSLETQAQGVEYILKHLEAHGSMVDSIRGMHLQQSLTGKYCQALMENPPVLSRDRYERTCQLYTHIFNIDKHEPWTDPSVRKVVDFVSPEYLTFELMSHTREQHMEMLNAQKHALGII